MPEVSGAPRRASTWVFGISAAALLIAWSGVMASWGWRYTNEDQTLLWLAARDWLHGTVHQPTFYGQSYGTTFEVLPAVVLRLLAIPSSVGVPLCSAGLAAGCWLVLGRSAWTRGDAALAVGALAVPVCLGAPYLMLASAPRGVVFAHACGCAAAAVVLRKPQSFRCLVAGVALGSLAVGLDFSIALVVVPVLVAMAVHQGARLWQPRRRLAIMAAAALPGPVWWGFVGAFDHRHPQDLTAPGVVLTPTLQQLFDSLSNLDRYVSAFAPVPQLAPVLPLAAIVAAVSITVVRGGREGRAAAAALAIVVGLALAAPKAADAHPGLYLSGARLLLPLPLGIWTVVAAGRLGRSSAGSGATARTTRVAALVLVPMAMVVALTSGGVLVGSTAADRAASYVHITRVDELARRCADLAALAAASPGITVVTEDRVAGYGCASRGMNTLIPSYDRRGWVIQQAESVPIGRFLLSGIRCRTEPAPGITCRPVAANASIVVVTPEAPLAAALSRLGVHVRTAHGIRAAGEPRPVVRLAKGSRPPQFVAWSCRRRPASRRGCRSQWGSS